MFWLFPGLRENTTDFWCLFWTLLNLSLSLFKWFQISPNLIFCLVASGEINPWVNRHDVLQMHIPPHCVGSTYYNKDLVGWHSQAHIYVLMRTHQVHLSDSVWGETDDVMLLLFRSLTPPSCSRFINLSDFSDFFLIRSSTFFSLCIVFFVSFCNLCKLTPCWHQTVLLSWKGLYFSQSTRNPLPYQHMQSKKCPCLKHLF